MSVRRKRIHILMTAILTAAVAFTAPVRPAGAFPEETGEESSSAAFEEEGNESAAEEESRTEGIGEEEGESLGEEETAENPAGAESSAGEEESVSGEGKAPDEDESLTGTPSEAQEEKDVPLIDDRSTPSQAEPLMIATPSSAMIMLYNDIAPEGCGSAEELERLVAAGETDRIVVASDIVLEEDSYISLETENAVTIDMNGNRLIVSNGSDFNVRGPIRIEGEVPGQALIQVDGSLCLEGGAEVAARGESCTAVLYGSTGGGFTTWDAAVMSEGAGSRAIVWQNQEECFLEYALIRAEGRNSAAIVSAAPVRLFLCNIKSEGANSIITDAAVRLDASAADPLPEQAKVIRRKAYATGREEQNGICVAAGSDLQELYDKLLLDAYYAFCDLDGIEEPKWYSMDVTWSGLPEDLSTAGNYMSECSPVSLRDWCDVTLPSQRVPIHVVDPLEPHIEEIFRMERTVAFRYLADIKGEELRLMYSADEGKTWQDAAEIPGGSLELDEHMAVLDGLPINRDYLFKIVVSGGPMEGESAAVPFYFYKNDADRWGHGDRDGDDRNPPHYGGDGDIDGDGRGEQGEKLPDPVPPIFTENSSYDSGEAVESSTGSDSSEAAALPALGDDIIAAKGPEEGTPSPSESVKESVQKEAEGGNEPGGKGADDGDEPGQKGAEDRNEPGGKGADDGDESGQKGAEDGDEPGGKGADDGDEPGGKGAEDGNEPGGKGADDESGTEGARKANLKLTFRQFNDQLLTNENWIMLTADGIKVELPAARLRELNLEEDEEFAACIQRYSADRFGVRFWAGEEEVEEFGETGFLVELPWEGTSRYEKVICRRTDGLLALSEAADTGIRNRIYKTGEYVIRLEGEKPQEKHPWSAAAIAAAVGMICCAALALFGLLRYWRILRGGGV